MHIFVNYLTWDVAVPGKLSCLTLANLGPSSCQVFLHHRLYHHLPSLVWLIYYLFPLLNFKKKVTLYYVFSTKLCCQTYFRTFNKKLFSTFCEEMAKIGLVRDGVKITHVWASKTLLNNLKMSWGQGHNINT